MAFQGHRRAEVLQSPAPRLKSETRSMATLSQHRLTAPPYTLVPCLSRGRYFGHGLPLGFIGTPFCRVSGIR